MERVTYVCLSLMGALREKFPTPVFGVPVETGMRRERNTNEFERKSLKIPNWKFRSML